MLLIYFSAASHGKKAATRLGGRVPPTQPCQGWGKLDATGC